MRQAPCKTCPDRGCGSRHDTCEKYAEWVALNDRRKADKDRDAIADNVILKHRHVAFRIWQKKGRRK